MKYGKMKQNTALFNMADDAKDLSEPMDVDLMANQENTNASNCLSVTNVPVAVFNDENIKGEFEKIFLAFDEGMSITYLKSFRRVRVTFSTTQIAVEAKLVLHGAKYRGAELGLYYVQPLTSNPGTSMSSQLQPPPLTKQFLISPPASPPVGWEQSHEASPIINYDLLNAVASLDTSQPYELHPPDTDYPRIVVHLCDEEEEGTGAEGEKKFHPLKSMPREDVQTRRPNCDS